VDELDPQPAGVQLDVVTGSNGELIVTIAGELDITAVDDLQDRVAPLLERGATRLIVDVSQVRFADSSAIALWVRWAAAAHHFELRDPHPLLRRVIAGMGLTDKLAVEP
jgi:anti-anti-sigma factor